MEALLRDLQKSFEKRYGNIELQKSTWKKIVEIFPPLIDPEQTVRPSVLLSSEAGDVGLSILWIVQAVIIRCQIKGLLTQIDKNSRIGMILSSVSNDLIGALAHTDDKINSLIISKEKDDIILSGVKKYITGGRTADFILLTARHKTEEKVSELIYLPVPELPDNTLKELPLQSLMTTSHAQLSLENFRLSGSYRFGIEETALRRSLKKWSIIERSLILEASMAFTIYLHNKLSEIRGKEINDIARLKELLDSQTAIVRNQLLSALNDSYIPENTPDLSYFNESKKTLKDAFEKNREGVPEGLKLRFKDFYFFRS